MVLNVLKYPDPFLKSMAEPVDKIDPSIRKLIEDMTETMYKSKGIGLAATQVGVAKRICVLDVPDQKKDGSREERVQGKNLIALINPEITEREGSITYEEGCLSIPGINADVVRAASITVSAIDRDGNPVQMRAEGLFSIAIQHEIDHLDGILFIDRLSRLRRDIIKRKIRKMLEAEERAL